MKESEELVAFADLPIWYTAAQRCPTCGTMDVSVYPLTAERLECSGCHAMNPAPPLPHERQMRRRP